MVRQEQVLLEIDEDGIATITLNDADSNNGLSSNLVTGLKSAFSKSKIDTQIAVIILRGSSEYFCSGATHEVLHGIASGDVPLAELDLPMLLLDAPVPVISAMAGDAIGGGFTLGLAADIVVLCQSSRYGFNFLDYGLTPGMGTTSIAQHFLGPGLAQELMYSGEFRRGRDFLQTSNIAHIVDQGDVDPLARDIARRIASKPTFAVRALKCHFSAARQTGFVEARQLEDEMHRLCLAEAETIDRIRAQDA